jgi:hypothetical protein
VSKDELMAQVWGGQIVEDGRPEGPLHGCARGALNQQRTRGPSGTLLVVTLNAVSTRQVGMYP